MRFTLAKVKKVHDLVDRLRAASVGRLLRTSWGNLPGCLGSSPKTLAPWSHSNCPLSSKLCPALFRISK